MCCLLDKLANGFIIKGICGLISDSLRVLTNVKEIDMLTRTKVVDRIVFI